MYQAGRKNLKKPITIARHAYGDVNGEPNTGFPVKEKLNWFLPAKTVRFPEAVYDFECPGVLQSTFNKDASIFPSRIRVLKMFEDPTQISGSHERHNFYK